MKLSDCQTPSLVLDQRRMEANIDRMRRTLPRGVELRFHAKTPKSMEVVERVLRGRPPVSNDNKTEGITVSTLKEAEFFFAQGIHDIVYAVGLAPNKFDRVRRLLEAGADLTCIVDSPEQIEAVVRYARNYECTFPLMVEIDTDGHRSGVAPIDSGATPARSARNDPRTAPLLDLATAIVTAPHLDFRGILTHAGESYSCETIECMREIARRERDAMVASAEALRFAGIACPRVSIGSTPTVLFADDFTGVTEVRAGVYIFFDLVMAGLGVCRIDEIALSVLTSVIGRQEEKGWIVTDAGWMALSRDRGTADQAVDQGYGVVCDLAGRPIGDLIVKAANQEHGIISSRSSAPVDPADFPVGRLLRILPNHACATTAAFSEYVVVAGDRGEPRENRIGGVASDVSEGTIVDRWPRFNGW